MAHFRNDSGHALNLDRFDLYVPADAVFDVYDDDADSLRFQPAFTEVDVAGNPLAGEQASDEPAVLLPVVTDPAPAAAAVDVPAGAPTGDPTPTTDAPVAE